VVAVEGDRARAGSAYLSGPAGPERDSRELSRERDGSFDPVVCVGNVMVFLAEGSERERCTR